VLALLGFEDDLLAGGVLDPQLDPPFEAEVRLVEVALIPVLL
jgi:hypothetical protein